MAMWSSAATGALSRVDTAAALAYFDFAGAFSSGNVSAFSPAASLWTCQTWNGSMLSTAVQEGTTSRKCDAH